MQQPSLELQLGIGPPQLIIETACLRQLLFAGAQFLPFEFRLAAHPFLAFRSFAAKISHFDMRSHTGQQFACCEGLDEIVVGVGLQPFHARLFARPCRHQNHWRARRRLNLRESLAAGQTHPTAASIATSASTRAGVRNRREFVSNAWRPSTTACTSYRWLNRRVRYWRMSALSSATTIGARFAFGVGLGRGQQVSDARLGGVAASFATPGSFPESLLQFF